MDSLLIPVILASVRRNRQSPMVASWMVQFISDMDGVESGLVDLGALDIPIMEERLRMRQDTPQGVKDLSEVVASADGLVIVTPEYNSGYPGVLKNALDYLLPEFRRTPVGIVTVSAGGFGGLNCLSQLRLVLMAMGALPIPAVLPVSRVQKSFSDKGPDGDGFKIAAARFMDELQWWSRANVLMSKENWQLPTL